jgi:4-oxalocrotonate tautomerase
MPRVRISVYRWTPETEYKAIADAVYEAMREAIGVPAGDRFITVTSHEPHEMFADPDYLGIHRSERFILVEITLAAGRTVEKKQALYKRIAERLHEATGVGVADVMTVLTENSFADWSFGNGEAQYVLNPPAWAKQAAQGD